MANTNTSNHLSQVQIKSYWENGFLCPIPAISPQQCQDWRAQLETIEGDWLDNGLPRALNVYKRVNAHVVMQLASEIAAHSAILDVVEGILGLDIFLLADRPAAVSGGRSRAEFVVVAVKQPNGVIPA